MDNGGTVIKSEEQVKKKRTKQDTQFKPGYHGGRRFGEGQPTNLGGRKKGAAAVLKEMEAAAEKYGMAASQIADKIIEHALSPSLDPKDAIAYLKEVNLRVFGQPKNSLEEILKQFNQKADKLYELSIPVLEATAIGDGVGLIRELRRQGKLNEALEKAMEE